MKYFGFILEIFFWKSDKRKKTCQQNNKEFFGIKSIKKPQNIIQKGYGNMVYEY